MQETEIQSQHKPDPTSQNQSSTQSQQSTTVGGRSKRQARRLGKENRGISRKHSEKISEPINAEVISSSGSSFSQSSPSDSGRSSLGNNPRVNSPKREEFKDCDTTLVSPGQVNHAKFKPNSSFNNKTLLNCSDETKDLNGTSQNSKGYTTTNSDNESKVSHPNQVEDTEEKTVIIMKERKETITTAASESEGVSKSVEPKELTSPEINDADNGKSERDYYNSTENSYNEQKAGYNLEQTSAELKRNGLDPLPYKVSSLPFKLTSQNKINKTSPSVAFDNMITNNQTSLTSMNNSQMMYFYSQATGQIIMLPVSGANGIDLRPIDETAVSAQPGQMQPSQLIYPPVSNQYLNMASHIDLGSNGNGNQAGSEDYSFLTGQQQNPASPIDSQNFHGLLPLIFQNGNNSQGNFNVEQQFLAWQQHQNSLGQNPSHSSTNQSHAQQQANPLLLCQNGSPNNNFLYPITSANNGNFLNISSAPIFLDSNTAINGQPNLRNSFLFNSLYNNNNKNSLNFSSSSSNGASFPGRSIFFPQIPIQQTNMPISNKKSNTRNQLASTNNNATNANSHNSPTSSQSLATNNRLENNGAAPKSDKFETKNFQKFLFNCDNLPFLNPDILKPKRHSSQTNLYLRGLPKDFTEEKLFALAPDKSLIRSVKLIVEDESECYGFIDFNSNESAKQALNHIKESNGEIYVNFAYESEKDPLNIYITNIPEIWTASNVEDLKKIFTPYGQILTAIVMTKRSNNFCTGAGFVKFCHSEDAQKAIEGIRKAQIILEGAKRPLEVKLADRQKTPEEQALLSQLKNSSTASIKSFYRNLDNVCSKTNSYQDLETQNINSQGNNNSNQGPKSHKMENGGLYRGNKSRSNHLIPASSLTNDHCLHMTNAHQTAINDPLAFPNQHPFPYPTNASTGYNSKINLAVAMLQSPAVFSAAVAASNAYNGHQQLPDNLYFANQHWPTETSEAYSAIPNGTSYQM